MSDKSTRNNVQLSNFDYTLNAGQYNYDHVAPSSSGPPRNLISPTLAPPTFNLGLDFIAQQPYIQQFHRPAISFCTRASVAVETEEPHVSGKTAISQGQHAHSATDSPVPPAYSNPLSSVGTSRRSRPTPLLRVLAPIRSMKDTNQQDDKKLYLPSVLCILLLYLLFLGALLLICPRFVVPQNTRTFASSVTVAQARI